MPVAVRTFQASPILSPSLPPFLLASTLVYLLSRRAEDKLNRPSLALSLSFVLLPEPPFRGSFRPAAGAKRIFLLSKIPLFSPSLPLSLSLSLSSSRDSLAVKHLDVQYRARDLIRARKTSLGSINGREDDDAAAAAEAAGRGGGRGTVFYGGILIWLRFIAGLSSGPLTRRGLCFMTRRGDGPLHPSLLRTLRDSSRARFIDST